MLVRLALIIGLIVIGFSLFTMSKVSSATLDYGYAKGSAPVELPIASPTPEESWLRLPTLPTTASQADIGAEIYRLVCRDCHGDVGQGLTNEWRATWNPEDQNCWQSKCHASNHPPDGFDLPHLIPAIIGPTALAHFDGESELYEYIRINMPWHNPGSLTDQEYQQLTEFLVRENGWETSVDGPVNPDPVNDIHR